MRKKIEGNIKEEFWSFFLVGFPNKKAFLLMRISTYKRGNKRDISQIYLFLLSINGRHNFDRNVIKSSFDYKVHIFSFEVSPI